MYKGYQNCCSSFKEKVIVYIVCIYIFLCLFFFIKKISNRYPNNKLIGLSYSLGANILVKYLGEEGENSGFEFAISLANPLDM